MRFLLSQLSENPILFPWGFHVVFFLFCYIFETEMHAFSIKKEIPSIDLFKFF